MGMTNSDEAVSWKGKQHEKPCHDCPMRVNAIPGWLGGSTSQEYAQMLHSDQRIDCHAFRGAQCAGAAIYRSNVAKKPRDPNIFILPKDRETVFSNPKAFIEYHKDAKSSDEEELE